MKIREVILGTFIMAAYVSQAFAFTKKRPRSNNDFFSGKEIAGEIIHPGLTEIDQSKISISGMVQRAHDSTDDERVKGDLTIVTNAQLDPATRCGPIWGTFILSNSGGSWLAAWLGRISAHGSKIYAMGYGVGEYESLMANWTYTRTGKDPQTPFDIQGFIVKVAEP